MTPFKGNAAKFSQICESGINGGADPLVRAGPLDPLLANEIRGVRENFAALPRELPTLPRVGHRDFLGDFRGQHIQIHIAHTGK